MKPEDFIKEAQAWAKAQGLPDPWKRFVDNVESAEQRGIAWMLSFQEWWTLWKPHYHERGRKRGEKVLCRYLDQGDYRAGNVRIDLGVNNAVERGVANRLTKQKSKPSYSEGGRNLALSSGYMSPRPLRPDEALEIARGEVEEIER